MPVTKDKVKLECYNWSAELAYFIGFFLADGYLNDGPNRGYLQIALSSKDEQLLEEFSLWLYGYNISKNIGERGKTVFNGNIIKRGPQSRLTIFDKKFYEFVRSLGITNNKSFTAQMPLIPDEYFFDFARGYIDGDGWISYFNKSDSLCVGMIGSVDFINSIKVIFESKGYKFKIKIHEYSQQMLSLWMFGNRQCDTLLREIYKSGSFSLSRKKDVWERVKKINAGKDSGAKKQGYTYISRYTKPYLVRIFRSKKLVYSKFFATPEEAKEAYTKKRLELFT